MAGQRKPVAVIGVGNDLRRDDGVGLFVARRVGGDRPEKVKVTCGVPDGTAILEAWSGAQLAMVVDCVSSGASAGRIYRFDALAERLPEALFSRVSTHCFSIIKVIELARAIGRLPGKLLVYGIEGGDTDCGEGLTPAVRRAAEVVVNKMVADIDGLIG